MKIRINKILLILITIFIGLPVILANDISFALSPKSSLEDTSGVYEKITMESLQIIHDHMTVGPRGQPLDLNTKYRRNSVILLEQPAELGVKLHEFSSEHYAQPFYFLLGKTSFRDLGKYLDSIYTEIKTDSEKDIIVPVIIVGNLQDSSIKSSDFSNFLRSNMNETYGKIRFVLILGDRKSFEEMFKNKSFSPPWQFLGENVGTDGFFDFTKNKSNIVDSSI